LKSAFVIRSAGWLIAALQVLESFLIDLCNLFSQVGDRSCMGRGMLLSAPLSLFEVKDGF